MTAQAHVTFAPAGVTVAVEAGVTLSDAARAAGVLIAAPCAGRGICGGCAVRVLSGDLAPVDEIEARALARAREGVRLACRARVVGDVEVRPLFSAGEAVHVARASASERAASRRAASAGRIVAGVDLGTTSVAVLLADAESGRRLARGAAPNRQQAFGADVLARISATLSGHAGELRALALESVREALASAAADAGVRADLVQRVVVAGNSAMAALFAGADVTPLAAHPFTAPTIGEPGLAGAASAVGADPGAEVLLVPAIASFVGGDALAATLAAGLVDSDAARLLVDIGTNAEIVLALPGGLFVTSAAAGPAFEGSGISCGGPAGPAAIQSVEILGDSIRLTTIGGDTALWFSGAGLVSALATLREAGHLAADGALVPEGPLAERFDRDQDGILGVRLSEEGAPLVRLTQLDVRALQLAKAAVRVAIESLLSHAGIRAADLSEVLVAGAFGAALEPADLVALGVLPSASAIRTRQVGNAALDGATAMALDGRLLDLAAATAAGAQHVELALEASFGEAFMSATQFAPYDA